MNSANRKHPLRDQNYLGICELATEMSIMITSHYHEIILARISIYSFSVRDTSVWFCSPKSNITLGYSMQIAMSFLFTHLLPRTDCTRCILGRCRHSCRDRSRIPAGSRSNTRRRTSRCRATKMPRFYRHCIRQAPFRRPDSWGIDLFSDRISRPFHSLPPSRWSARLAVVSKRLVSSRRSSRRRRPGDYVGAI